MPHLYESENTWRHWQRRKASAFSWEPWQKGLIISRINSLTRRSPSATSVFQHQLPVANSVMPLRMCGALSNQPRVSTHPLTARRDQPSRPRKIRVRPGQYIIWVEDSMGDWSIHKGESGTLGRCCDTNIVDMSLVAGLGCLCALSSVFTTKT
jgi:hypothetical protein